MTKVEEPPLTESQDWSSQVKTDTEKDESSPPGETIPPDKGGKTRVTSDVETMGDLQMPPKQMLDLARRAAEILVERIEKLPGENAWDGDFRQVLDDQLLEDPPEGGRPAAEVIERAARGDSPVLDPSRSSTLLRLRPVFADLARRAGRLHGRRLPHQRVHLAGRERPERGRAGGHRLVPALARLSRGRGRAVHERRLGRLRRCLRRGAGGCGPPERATVYTSDQSHSSIPRAAMIVGIRRECIRTIPSDAHFRMEMERLAAAVARIVPPVSPPSRSPPMPARRVPVPSIGWRRWRTSARQKVSGCMSTPPTAASRS